MMGEVRIDIVNWVEGIVTLCLAGILYMYPLKHRRRYWLRAFLGSATILLTGILLFLVGQMPLYLSILFLYLCMVAFVMFCTLGPWKSSAYCALWILVTQQTVYELWRILYRIPEVVEWFPSQVVCCAVVTLVLYTIAGVTLVRSLPEQGVYPVGPKQISSAIFLLVVFEMLFILFTMDDFHEELTVRSWIIILVQIYCITFLYVQNTLFRKSSMQQELNTLNHLWHQQKNQYEISKENIELINRKCHDLKHQIAAMRTMTSPEEQEKYLKEIEDSVQIYGSIVKTGNEVLDTVLTEKSLICRGNDITINCIADGRRMDVLDPVDVYTVFGNALDNAIESVKGISSREKKLIDVLVFMEKQFLFINIMNPIEASLKLENGIPLSTKIKNGYHGYGLKSIQHTAEKYDGFMKITTENQVFSLKILIPVQKS